VSKDHGVASLKLDRLVVAGVHDQALSGSTGHDGARGLGHGASELHDLSVPGLVRDLALSVLGNLLLSRGSPGGESSNVGHVLVVHGNGLESASRLALLVSGNLGASGVSGSAPVLDNLSLRRDSLGVGLLVGELVEELLGSLAHLGIEHVSLHGGGESDVADKLGVEGSSLSSGNDNSVSSKSGELSSLVGSNSVSDVEGSSDGGLVSDSVLLVDHSAGNSSGSESSGHMSSADGDSSSFLNGHSSERALGLSHEVSSGSNGSTGELFVAVDSDGGVSEVSGGEDGVSGEHSSLEVDLTSVLLAGSDDSEVSSAGRGLESTSADHVLSGSSKVNLDESGLNGNRFLGSHGSSVLILHLEGNSSSLAGKSDGHSSVVDNSKLEAVGNSSPVLDLLDESSVHGLSVNTDSSLLFEDLHLSNVDSAVSEGHSAVEDSNSSLLLAESDGDVVPVSVHLSHLLILSSKSDLEVSESNSLGVSSDSELASSVGDLLGGNSNSHVSGSNLSLLNKVVSDSKSADSLGVLGLVDLSPVVGSSNNGNDSSLSDSVGTSELHPDSSEVSLLGEEGSVVSNSVGELDLELLDLLFGSLLSSGGGSLSESVYPEFVGCSDLDHLLLGSDHEDVHLLGSDVSTVSLDSPSLGVSDKDDLSLDSSSSLGEGNLTEVDSDLVGLDGSSLEQDSALGRSSSKASSGDLLSPVSDHGVSVGFRLLHVGVSNSHSSSSLSG